MTIRQKLGGLVIALLCMMTMLGLENYFTLQKTNNWFKTTYDDRMVPMNQAKAVADLYAIQILDTSHKLSLGQLNWQDAAQKLREARPQIATQWKAFYNPAVMDPEETALADRAQAAMEKADAATTALEGIIARQSLEELDAFRKHQLYQNFDPVLDLMQQLIDLQLNEAKKNYATAQDDFRGFLMLTIGLTALALVLGGLGAWWLIRALTGKVDRLVNVFDHARRENDLTRRIPVSGSDELDRLASAFNMLMDNIDRLVCSAAKAVQMVEVEARLLSDASAQVSNATSMASEATASTAAAVEQITVSISHITANAQDARSQGVKTNQVAAQGGSQIQASLEGIGRIQETIQDAAGRVEELGAEAQRIEGIVSVIKEVADQTNLLALNAAIEAARAGETGRGFAVVADEVRKLAERTGTATNEITAMIGTIRDASANAVTAMHASTHRVSECVELARTAEASTRAIQEHAVSAEQASVEIATSLSEQRSGVDQIASQIEKIAQTSEENSASISSMSQTAQRLSELTHDLQLEIMRFKLSER